MRLVLTEKLEITPLSDNMGLSYINVDAATLGTQRSSESMSTFATEMWSLEQHHHLHLKLAKMQFLI